MSEFTHDDICAAWFAQQHYNLQSALEQAPDAEAEALARQMWRHGKEVLETHTAHASGSFPVGADPQGGRLEEFIRANGIVAWTETSAGHVATAAQVCYLGLAERSDPNNSRARSDAIQAAARALLLEHNIPLNQAAPLRELAPLLVDRTGCHIDTAKRHLATAQRRARGEAAAAWGGARPGAGRPKTDMSNDEGAKGKAMETTLPIDEITQLAVQVGVDAQAAIAAFTASARARAVGLRDLRAWQQENQDQANIVSTILMQREANLSMNE